MTPAYLPFIRQLFDRMYRSWRVIGREWLIAMGLVTGLSLWLLLGHTATQRLDNIVYDVMLQSYVRPANPDIVLVTFDAQSQAKLGPTALNGESVATVVSRLGQAQNVLLNIDLPASDPGIPVLAETMSRQGNVLLPYLALPSGSMTHKWLPQPSLMAAAAGLCNLDFVVSSDAMVRSFYLQEGNALRRNPHCAIAMLQPAAASRLDMTDREVATHNYDLRHIPFAGKSGHFTEVTFSDVLQGKVSAAIFQRKYVLLGATVTGLGDDYAVPVNESSTRMADIEVLANAMDALRQNITIRDASTLLKLSINLFPLLILYFCIFFFSARRIILLFVTLGAGVLAASAVLMQFGIWVTPVPCVISLVLAYPLWSWRRLEAALAYMQETFDRIRQEPLPRGTPQTTLTLPKVLDERIARIREVADQMSDWRQFMFDGINSAPDAALIVDASGRVVVANQAAARRFSGGLEDPLYGRFLSQLLLPYEPQIADQLESWMGLLDTHAIAAAPEGIEVVGSDGKRLLVKCVPFVNVHRKLSGWIVSIIDISSLRQAEQGRDEALRFLSHDMRAPQASILALIDMQRSNNALPPDEFLARVEQYARRALGLADDFVQLARAEAQHYHFEEESLLEIVCDAMDEMWALANSRHIKLVYPELQDEAMVLADRRMLTRVMINLISNAIKYSPMHTAVRCHLYRDAQHWCCEVIDQGYGVTPEQQAAMFNRFTRFMSPEHPVTEGIGLGLAFVKTVLDRHGASVTVESQPGKGTIIRVALLMT
ncbi:CHASE2 domain-containing protein [Leeia oryzae]|uniref:CHASE2 domain-containing protein n=1 Tax=Leeia oryzae TaxID=356662 RepID=UPI000379E6E3|nr:CHASE2 domain-containing protein [Leeia oryzae]